MSDLYPTPTRLTLLQDVADGEVWQQPDGRSVVTWTAGLGVSDPVRQCTAAIADLERAGWVQVKELKYGSRQWQLTDAGHAVLAAAGKEG